MLRRPGSASLGRGHSATSKEMQEIYVYLGELFKIEHKKNNIQRRNFKKVLVPRRVIWPGRYSTSLPLPMVLVKMFNCILNAFIERFLR